MKTKDRILRVTNTFSLVGSTNFMGEIINGDSPLNEDISKEDCVLCRVVDSNGLEIGDYEFFYDAIVFLEKEPRHIFGLASPVSERLREAVTRGQVYLRFLEKLERIPPVMEEPSELASIKLKLEGLPPSERRARILDILMELPP